MSTHEQEDKTEEPSEKRRKEAREKGQIVRSKDWNTLVLLLGASLGILYFSNHLVKSITAIFSQSLTLSHENVINTNYISEHLIIMIKNTSKLILPLLMVFVGSVVLGNITIGGLGYSTENLMPKFNRLDPLAGLKKIISKKSLIELFKSVLKLVVLMGCAACIMFSMQKRVENLGFKDIHLAIFESFDILTTTFILLSCSLIIIALFDVPLQMYQFIQQLKMTKQEVRDEYKETQGNPEIKSKIKRLQQQMSRKRMMENVAKADVIITNPTHFAVAIKYEPNQGAAPVVVGKGADVMAEMIRKVAAGNNIPLVCIPTLARAIYYNVDIDREIPQGLYIAVAKVLAYIYELKLYRTGKVLEPNFPDDVPIPDDLKR